MVDGWIAPIKATTLDSALSLNTTGSPVKKRSFATPLSQLVEVPTSQKVGFRELWPRQARLPLSIPLTETWMEFGVVAGFTRLNTRRGEELVICKLLAFPFNK